MSHRSPDQVPPKLEPGIISSSSTPAGSAQTSTPQNEEPLNQEEEITSSSSSPAELAQPSIQTSSSTAQNEAPPKRGEETISSSSSPAEPAQASIQKSSSTPTVTQSSSAPASTYTITVGNGDHKFRPDVTQAEIGDTIEFRFFPANHSVVRAEYGFPCIPYEMTGKGKTGFFSQFHPVDAFLPDPPKWTVKINSSDPIFFYCSAPGSCIDFGMVGVINPNSTTSLVAQRDLALDSAYALNPGDPFPAESSQSPTNPLSPSIPSPTSSPSSSASSKNGLPPGAIAGIVIASIFVVAIAAVLFFYVGRARSLKQEVQRKESTIRHVPPPSPMLQAHYAKFNNPNIPPIYHASGVHGPPANTRSWAEGASSAGSPPPLGRGLSHRSVGGTFDLNHTSGQYRRTYDGDDSLMYAVAQSSDAVSPIANWGNKANSMEGGIALGPYGRQEVAGAEGLPAYSGPVDQIQPAEMDGTGVQQEGKPF